MLTQLTIYLLNITEQYYMVHMVFL